MPSSDKTAFLALNQWTGADQPKREDFNEDNRRADEGVAALAGGIDAHTGNSGIHVGAADRANWDAACCASGTYTGNGESYRSIGIGFRPRFGWFFAVGTAPTIYVSTHSHNYFGFVSEKGCSMGLTLEDKGFQVMNQPGGVNGWAVKYNESGVTYIYCMWP